MRPRSRVRKRGGAGKLPRVRTAPFHQGRSDWRVRVPLPLLICHDKARQTCKEKARSALSYHVARHVMAAVMRPRMRRAEGPVSWGHNPDQRLAIYIVISMPKRKTIACGT